jgi:hypothetical protein
MTFAPIRPTLRLGVLALGALLTLSLSNGAWAQWKWKDKSGHTQYSDLPPPPSVGDQDILQRPVGSTRRSAPAFVAAPASAATSSPVAASGAAKVEPELEAKRRKAEQEEAARKKAEEEKMKLARADNCQRAKVQLRTLDEGTRMARINAKGEREVLDDKARAEETKRTREVISADCS